MNVLHGAFASAGREEATQRFAAVAIACCRFEADATDGLVRLMIGIIVKEVILSCGWSGRCMRRIRRSCVDAVEKSLYRFRLRTMAGKSIVVAIVVEAFILLVSVSIDAETRVVVGWLIEVMLHLGVRADAAPRSS